jgi:hypothetical protein
MSHDDPSDEIFDQPDPDHFAIGDVPIFGWCERCGVPLPAMKSLYRRDELPALVVDELVSAEGPSVLLCTWLHLCVCPRCGTQHVVDDTPPALSDDELADESGGR